MEHQEKCKTNLKREMGAIVTVLFVSIGITFAVDSLTGLFESGTARWIRVLAQASTAYLVGLAIYFLVDHSIESPGLRQDDIVFGRGPYADVPDAVRAALVFSGSPYLVAALFALVVAVMN